MERIERIELTEPKLLQRLGPNCILGLRNHNFVREREERENVAAPLQV